MTGMRIQRYRRSQGPGIGCGCLLLVSFGLVGLFGLLYATGLLVPIILAVTSVERVGSTDTIFTDTPTQPPVVVQNPVSPPRQVQLDLGSYGRQTVTLDTRNYTVVTGATNTGAPLATTTFTEDALLEICAERTDICRNTDSRLRNVSFDARPGGIIIYADANTSAFWQRVGIVLQVDPVTQSTFRVVGVDVDGTTYNPDTLPFGLAATVGPLLRDIEREGNEILRNLVVQAGGNRYQLRAISIDDTTVTLVLS
ncbi:MAG: hypothetical protein ACOCX3_02400 [Chloroflexota bacterium]